jgi:hypothetical protein
VKINVLFIKRKYSLNDAPEAYACHDDETAYVNPDWPVQQEKEMLKDCASDMDGGQHRWIAINVSDAELDEIGRASWMKTPHKRPCTRCSCCRRNGLRTRPRKLSSSNGWPLLTPNLSPLKGHHGTLRKGNRRR